jgi:hypothetical protein
MPETATLATCIPWCDTVHGDGDCCDSGTFEIPGVGFVYLSWCAEEGAVLHVIDPKRGLHEYGTQGQYRITEAKAVIAAMAEAVRVAESCAVSASGACCTEAVRS